MRKRDQSPIHIFGYGSLMNLKSAEKTLGRPLARADALPATLRDYVRRWDLAAWVVLEEAGEHGAVPAVFLNIAPRPGSRVNGILIRVNAQELARMDAREKNYVRVDVAPLIEPRPIGRVFGYVGRKEHTSPPPGSVVLSAYEAIVQEGLLAWGQAFADGFAYTTLPHNFPRRDGPYLLADPGQSTGQAPASPRK